MVVAFAADQMRDNEQNNSGATGSLRLHLMHRNRGHHVLFCRNFLHGAAALPV